MNKGLRYKIVKRPARAGMLFILAFLFMYPLKSQTEAEFRIRWVGEFPGRKGDVTSSFGDRVSRIVFGKKAQEVIKPFNIVAANRELYWILDQGAGGVIEVEGGDGALIRPMKRTRGDYSSLVGLCRLNGGEMLFTDSRLNRIVRIVGDRLLTFGDSLTLDQPTGIAYNRRTGEIWVVETGAHRISLFSSEGKLIRKVGERGSGPALFNFPTFIWIGREGKIYVVDSMNNRIQILDSEGVFLASFGEAGDATGYMARPKGIATDSKGHIYVADALFHAVQIFDAEGSFLYSFGSQGQGKGQFWMPAGLYVDEEDYIYVADSYNARIQVFQLEKEGMK